MDECRGAEFGFEECVAAVAIDVVGVCAETERHAAEPAENGGGSSGRGGPDAVDDVGFLMADAVGAADGEDRGPDGGPEILEVGGSITAVETPAVTEQGGVAEEFAGKGDDEGGEQEKSLGNADVRMENISAFIDSHRPYYVAELVKGNWEASEEEIQSKEEAICLEELELSR